MSLLRKVRPYYGVCRCCASYCLCLLCVLPVVYTQRRRVPGVYFTWVFCVGLIQLCAVEPRFEPYQNTLFSQAGLETNRDERTKAENAAMDASIEAYLRLLTDHFLSVAAFQTLEYLTRRYRSGFLTLADRMLRLQWRTSARLLLSVQGERIQCQRSHCLWSAISCYQPFCEPGTNSSFGPDSMALSEPNAEVWCCNAAGTPAAALHS